MNQPLRIIMLGTGDFAVPVFLHLLDSVHEVLALYTQPDRPQGRKQEVRPSRIHLAARERGVRVEQPEDVNAESSLAAIRCAEPDLLVTAAYGQILSGELLGIPRLGGLNLHGSILPSYRGAAPVARAIQQGERETGVTVIQMTPRIDAGGMLSIARAEIGPDETAGELEARLAEAGAPLVIEAITALSAGSARIIPQDRALVTRAPKLRKEDGLIDWNRPAQGIHDLVRAMQPWPTAQTTWHAAGEGREGVRLIVHRTRPCEGTGPAGQVIESEGGRLVVAAGEGALELLIIQVPGKRAMTVSEFLRGNRVRAGDRMGA